MSWYLKAQQEDDAWDLLLDDAVKEVMTDPIREVSLEEIISMAGAYCKGAQLNSPLQKVRRYLTPLLADHPIPYPHDLLDTTAMHAAILAITGLEATRDYPRIPVSSIPLFWRILFQTHRLKSYDNVSIAEKTAQKLLRNNPTVKQQTDAAREATSLIARSGGHTP